VYRGPFFGYGKPDKFFMGKPSQNYGLRGVAEVWCHTILYILAARHKRAHPDLTPASKEGWKAELTWVT